jgi:FkbM family methyltransferase
MWHDRPNSVPIRETLYLGHPFVYPSDSLIGAAFIDKGKDWDITLRTIVPVLLPKEEPVICEVGSNIGASLLQILAVKPRARVLACEPSDRFRPFLEHNLELAGFDHVEILPLLMGSKSGSMWLYNNSSSASVVSADYDGHEPRGKELIEMTTLDDVFRDRDQVDFIKTDTDGFDFEVLRGAEATLRRDRPILFFEFDVDLLSEPLADLMWLQSVGYRRLVCLAPEGELVGMTENPEQVVAWAGAREYCDVLACIEHSAAEARLGRLLFR